jgi:predicted nucleic acid-binding protein
MSDSVFVDSNVLIYALDNTAGAKHLRARALLGEIWERGNGTLSIQVLQEVFVNVTRKIPKPLPIATAREVISTYRYWVKRTTTVETVLRGIDIQATAQLSFWDSLIIAAAEEADAETLYSEDLQHGRTVAGVTIINPFVTS